MLPRLLLVVGCGNETESSTEAALATSDRWPQFGRTDAPTAFGQYSAADCTGPQMVRTDSAFGFTRGISYSASAIPTGTFHTFWWRKKAAGADPNLKFFFSAACLAPLGLA